jgi:hypothetical protein
MGGAVYADQATRLQLLQGCTFSGNSVNGTGARGGAVAVVGSATATLQQVRMDSNSAGDISSSAGGAVFATDQAELSVDNSSFSNNSVYGEFAAGGAITHQSAKELVVANASVFAANSAIGPKPMGECSLGWGQLLGSV